VDKNKFNIFHVASIFVFSLLASESDKYCLGLSSSVQSPEIKFRAITQACAVCVVDGI
jgi:hypothetical protein